MKRNLLVLALVWAFAIGLASLEAIGQTVVLRDAPLVKFPSPTDSNSPCHWDGETFYMLNSQGHPFLYVRLGPVPSG